MIRLMQPSLALHAHDVPSFKYQMKITKTLPKGAGVHAIVKIISQALQDHPDLQNVVINSHGSPGEIWAGGSERLLAAIRYGNLGAFRKIKNCIKGSIFLIACDVARFKKGMRFCGRMAKVANCGVVASTKSQFVEVSSCPFGFVDNFERPAIYWNGSGDTSVVNPSTSSVKGVGTKTANPFE